jgi:hypothetical protein
VWPHRVTDARHVRSHQAGGDLRLVTPLAMPPVSTTPETASDRDGAGYRTASARIYAGVHGLSTAPSPMACRGHHRGDPSESQRGRTAMSPPSLAVFLWTHRQVCAFVCRIRPLLQTFVAAWSRRGY